MVVKLVPSTTVGPQYVLWTEICRGKEHVWLVEQRLPSRSGLSRVVIQILYLSSVYLLSAFYVIPQIVFFSYVTVSEYDTL